MSNGHTPERKSLGFMYIARRPTCGRATAMCWDEPGHEKSTGAAVAKYIKRGDTVERVERFTGEPLPEMICRSHEPCACREAQHQAALAFAVNHIGGAAA